MTTQARLTFKMSSNNRLTTSTSSLQLPVSQLLLCLRTHKGSTYPERRGARAKASRRHDRAERIRALRLSTALALRDGRRILPIRLGIRRDARGDIMARFILGAFPFHSPNPLARTRLIDAARLRARGAGDVAVFPVEVGD